VLPLVHHIGAVEFEIALVGAPVVLGVPCGYTVGNSLPRHQSLPLREGFLGFSGLSLEALVVHALGAGDIFLEGVHLQLHPEQQP
jgi:hypothetical protein